MGRAPDGDKMKLLLAFVLMMTAVLGPIRTYGHVEQPKSLQDMKDQQGIGLIEKLGQTVPLDLIFSDENGNPVRLRQLIRTPTLLALVYYHCPNVCSTLLQGVAEVLNKLSAEPGKEYRVLAISFDETEKPDFARERKGIYLKMIEKTFPEEAWRFLTGNEENIRRLTDAVGFHFKREGQDFLHPVSLIILSSEGKVIRYLSGTGFLPFDLKMALLEASEGRVGPTIGKVARFCFSYDPKGRKYVFNTLKVTGIVTILFALSFVGFLIVRGKRRHGGEVSQDAGK